MKIFNDIKKEKMSQAEKEVGLNRLQAFMRSEEKSVVSPWHSPLSFNYVVHMKYATSFALVLLVFVLIGGTSVLARFSLPGDLLYPVKINLNEKVESFTATTPEQKALVEVGHIDTRLLEAEKLQTSSNLSDVAKTAIETQFKSDLGDAMVRVGKLDNSGKSDEAQKIEVKIENSLQKHKEIVGRILEKKKQEIVPVAVEMKINAVATTTEQTLGQIKPQTETAVLKSSKIASDIATSTEKEEENYKRREKNTPLLTETLEKAFPQKEYRKKDKKD
jgi:hypothetical protein